MTHQVDGPINLPYKFSIANQNFTYPVAVSAIYQKEMTHQEKDVTMSILLEYYAPEVEL